MAVEGEFFADDANVPVNLFLSGPEESDSGRWELSWQWFMPRKETCADAQHITADSREEITTILQEHALPLYRRGLALMEALIDGRTDRLYYWRQEREQSTPPNAS